MDLVVRAAFTFVFIFFVTRVVGRRELSSLEPFDLILLIVMGDLIQQGVTQNDFSVTGLVLVISTFAVLQVAVSYIHFRWRKARPVLDGEPIVLVENGRLIEKNLRRERLALEEVHEEMRLQQIESLDKVRWCVLETAGQMSFIEKSS